MPLKGFTRTAKSTLGVTLQVHTSTKVEWSPVSGEEVFTDCCLMEVIELVLKAVL